VNPTTICRETGTRECHLRETLKKGAKGLPCGTRAGHQRETPKKRGHRGFKPALETATGDTKKRGKLALETATRRENRRKAE